jgi:hypothetical protein
MSLHAAENVVENVDCLGDMRLFIQHDAFGSLAHRGIRYFRAASVGMVTIMRVRRCSGGSPNKACVCTARGAANAAA